MGTAEVKLAFSLASSAAEEMKISDSGVARTSLCKTKVIQNQTVQTVQKYLVSFGEISEYLSASWVQQ